MEQIWEEFFLMLLLGTVLRLFSGLNILTPESSLYPVVPTEAWWVEGSHITFTGDGEHGLKSKSKEESF